MGGVDITYESDQEVCKTFYQATFWAERQRFVWIIRKWGFQSFHKAERELWRIWRLSAASPHVKRRPLTMNHCGLPPSSSIQRIRVTLAEEGAWLSRITHSSSHIPVPLTDHLIRPTSSYCYMNPCYMNPCLLLVVPAAFRLRFFGKYSMSSEPCFGRR